MNKWIKASLLLASIAVVFAAIPSHPKPWTFAFRSGWNQACVEMINRVAADQETKLDPIRVINICDCASDAIQDRYSEEDVKRMRGHPPQSFVDFCTNATQACIESPI